MRAEDEESRVGIASSRAEHQPVAFVPSGHLYDGRRMHAKAAIHLRSLQISVRPQPWLVPNENETGTFSLTKCAFVGYCVRLFRQPGTRHTAVRLVVGGID